MNINIGRSWRDSASLIVLSRRNGESYCSRHINYDILLQTRTRSASFPNSVVFPGGVSEQADAADRWLPLIKSFGYSDQDFANFHRAGSVVTPIFQDNPVQRHISLRITAIRETFEELGLLLCSRDSKDKRSNEFASILSDIDVRHWRERISNNPGELLNLCKEYKCYPDIWSLYYWSNWLTPVRLPRRFSTAFFIAGVDGKPKGLKSNSEVTSVEWASPLEVLERPDVVLYPPQVYELKRLSQITDITELVTFAKRRSCYGEDLFYGVFVKVKDGMLHLLPGDDLYPSSVDYEDSTVTYIDETLADLRNASTVVHRLEFQKNLTPRFVFKNYKPPNHINMGDICVTSKMMI